MALIEAVDSLRLSDWDEIDVLCIFCFLSSLCCCKRSLKDSENGLVVMILHCYVHSNSTPRNSTFYVYHGFTVIEILGERTLAKAKAFCVWVSKFAGFKLSANQCNFSSLLIGNTWLNWIISHIILTQYAILCDWFSTFSLRYSL